MEKHSTKLIFCNKHLLLQTDQIHVIYYSKKKKKKKKNLKKIDSQDTSNNLLQTKTKGDKMMYQRINQIHKPYQTAIAYPSNIQIFICHTGTVLQALFLTFLVLILLFNQNSSNSGNLTHASFMKACFVWQASEVLLTHPLKMTFLSFSFLRRKMA